MSYIKINTDDLILDYKSVNNDVYTLVCRADMHKPNSWSLVPGIDLVRFDLSGTERHMYIATIRQIQQLQEIRCSQVNKIKEMLKSEIDAFHKTIDMSYKAKIK